MSSLRTKIRLSDAQAELYFMALRAEFVRVFLCGRGAVFFVGQDAGSPVHPLTVYALVRRGLLAEMKRHSYGVDYRVLPADRVVVRVTPARAGP